MLAKLSSKNQIVIPKVICVLFGLSRGDAVDLTVSGKRIIMAPKEIILKDKYPRRDLKAAERVLVAGKAGKERVFESGDAMLAHFKKKMKT